MTVLGLPELEKCLESLHLGVPIPQVDSAGVLTKPLDLCRVYLAEILGSLVECSTEAAYKAIQWPNNIFNGDLAVILPKLCPGAKAEEVAIDLMKKFPQDHPLFPLPFLDGVHFRIFLDRQALARLLLPYILGHKSTYGNDTTLGLREPPSLKSGRKKLVVEFSSPNIDSEFQGKHLRSTILGAFVSTLYESMGWDVMKINYLGDWGKNIALLRVGWEKFGNEEAYQTGPIGHLLDVHHRIQELFAPEHAASKTARDEAVRNGQDDGEAQAIENQGIFAERNAAFKKLEDGDEEVVAWWERVRDINIQHYKALYSRLGVMFDEYSGESVVSPDTVAEVEQMLQDKGISEESAGAWIVHMQKHGAKAGTAMLRDRTGASMYLLRDLAAVLERSRRVEFDKMIFVVASDNSTHFRELIKILEALDMKELAGKLQHLKFSEVSRMAEKLGKGYKPEDILARCEEATIKALNAEEKAGIFGTTGAITNLAVSALLVQELSTRMGTAHSFDTTTMTAFKPGTGVYLQYWYARLCSVLKDYTGSTELSDEDYEIFAEEETSNLLRVLVQYPEITHATFHSLEPAAIVTYLANVIEQLSACLDDKDEEEVQGEEGEAAKEEEEKQETQEAASAILAPGQAALYEATRVVLENGMKLLGLRPVATTERARADTPHAE